MLFFFYDFLYNFQTLITGVLALSAALITAIVIWRSAKLPIEEERSKQKMQEDQHQKHVKIILVSELDLVISNILKVKTSLYEIGLTNFSETYIIHLPEIFNHWTDMSLLGDDLLTNVNILRVTIMDYNFSAREVSTLQHSEKEGLSKELDSIAGLAKEIHQRIIGELKLLLNASDPEN